MSASPPGHHWQDEMDDKSALLPPGLGMQGETDDLLQQLGQVKLTLQTMEAMLVMTTKRSVSFITTTASHL